MSDLFENSADYLAQQLGARCWKQWADLSARCAQSVLKGKPCDLNEELIEVSKSDLHSPMAPAYQIWAGDNLMGERRYGEAIDAFDEAITAAQTADRPFMEVDFKGGAMYHKAQSAALNGKYEDAIAFFRELAQHNPKDRNPLFQAGLLAEASGNSEEAAACYSEIASSTTSPRADDPAQLGLRALKRMKETEVSYYASPRALADAVTRALDANDSSMLDACIARSHFAVGPLGGHISFEEDEICEQLYRDFTASRVKVRRSLVGEGEKFYLHTTGWSGEWFRGDVVFLLSKFPRGWRSTGVGITETSALWMEHWRPDVFPTNRRLTLRIEAPWPLGEHFMAGGLFEFGVKQAAVRAAGPCGAALALGFSRNRCGFGPRGFYYNAIASHRGADSFAIDFTRYRRNRPYDNESKGTPVLAAAGGLISRVRAGTRSGVGSDANLVEISHGDPDNPMDTNRYTTRYLHLEGPGMIPVRLGMRVIRGQRLGTMDDTGTSVVNHLHFSIHDRQLAHPDAPYGHSIRPTPMGFKRLGSGDSGACVRSNNRERTPGFNVRPGRIDFGLVPVGDIASVAVIMENSIGSPVDFSLNASPAGLISWPARSGTLADGETTSILVDFQPSGEGLEQASLTIVSNAPNSPIVINISGRGTGDFEPL